LLEAHDVSFGYRSRASILDGFSETFSGGEVVALTGASGRGKSTALYLLGLLLAPRSGEIEILGSAATLLSDAERSMLRARHIGFVFQDAALDPTRTVLDNVTETALYRGEQLADARERAHELLRRFGVELRHTHKPGQVSGGQAQRIALARALLARPEIVLADEPTGNLDAVSAGEVMRALHEAAGDGAVVVIATHDDGVVRRCQRVVNL